MGRTLRRVLIVLSIAGAGLCAAAAGAERSPSVIPTSQIRPGMKGHGLTVFRGTEPERFDVEVIDVLHNFRPDQDLIVVRTPHPVLEQAKVVAGMSGSPIYLDGKLAGAYAYGWSFGREPVAGVTPIANMLTEMRRPVRPDAFPGTSPVPRRAASARDRKKGARAAGSTRLAGLAPYRGNRPRHALDPLREYGEKMTEGPAASLLARASTPLMLGGLADGAAKLVTDALEPFGLVGLQAGGGRRRSGKASDSTDPPYVNGGALGVQLMRGDISATAVGTVTHVGAKRLIGFGHPMLNAGQIGLPAGPAKVLHVFQSQSRSFKIAEALETHGTMIHDRLSSVVVDRARKPTVVPITVRVHGVEDAPRTEWNVEVPNHRLLTPALTLAAVANAVEATASDLTNVVFRAESRVDIAGHGQVDVTDKGFHVGGAKSGVLGQLRLFELMEVAYGNPFRDARVQGAEVDLHLEFARDVVELVDVSVPAKEVDPGSTVRMRVMTRRYGEPSEVRWVPLRIPERAAGEELEIEIEPGDEVDLEQPEPAGLGDLVKGVLRRGSSTALVVSKKMPSRGLRFRGHVVHGLPPSGLDTMQLVNDSGHGQPFVTQEREVVDVGSVVVGTAKLKLQVRETPREDR
ncbi:MAG: SpoIVB peptidase S55 domain-containing protein [Myxococcota bacterium]